MNNAEKVQQFMTTYGQDVTGAVAFKNLEAFLDFRRVLVEEELDEMDRAVTKIDLFDAGLDQLYFVYGTMLGLGFTPEQITKGFDEVHRSNMSKLGEDGKPIYREDGKVLKGPNYFKPNLEQFL